MSECEYLFILGKHNAHVTPLVAIKDGRPRPVTSSALCWLLQRYTTHKLWQLGSARRFLNTKAIDFYDAIDNCSAVGSHRSKSDSVIASTYALASSESNDSMLGVEAKNRAVEVALQKLKSHPKTQRAVRVTRSTRERSSIFDDTPIHPRWHVEVRAFRYHGKRYVLVQGNLRAHPDCRRAPQPDACRDVLRSNPDAALRLSGVVLLRLPPAAKASAASTVELFKLGSTEDDTGRIELVDVVRVRNASSPWIVLKSTTDMGATWSYTVAYPSRSEWRFIEGGAESTI